MQKNTVPTLKQNKQYKGHIEAILKNVYLFKSNIRVLRDKYKSPKQKKI